MRRPREHWRRPPDVSGLSDQELVALALQGREEGFRGLVRRYEPFVIERIYDLVRDQDLTNDLAQQTWVKAFAKLRQHDPGKSFLAWVLRIAYNLTMDHFEKKPPPILPLDDTPEKGWPSWKLAARAAPVPGRAASREARLSALKLAIERAIEQLPRNQRRCVTLLYYEERSCEDIARILDMPVGTVKTHLSRARENLQRMLDPQSALWVSDSWPTDPFYSPA